MSSFQQPGYHVPRGTGVCAATGHDLAPGDIVFAALVELTDAERDALAAERPDDPALALGLRRVDVSEPAWREGFRPEGLFSFWKSAVPEPHAKPKLFVDDRTLLDLLARLEDAREPDRVAFRFVLALILLRKKLLRFDGQETRRLDGGPDGAGVEERSCWLLTPKLDPAKGPLGKWDDAHPVAVINPELADADVAAVTDQLGAVLASDL